MTRTTAEDIGTLWRLAVRLAKRRPGQTTSELWTSQPYLLDGHQVQARVLIEIVPVEPLSSAASNGRKAA